MPSSACKKCALDRKSTRLNSSHGSISLVAASLDRKSTRLNSSHGSISWDRKSTRLNSSHGSISYAVFCLKKKRIDHAHRHDVRGRVHAVADVNTPAVT